MVAIIPILCLSLEVGVDIIVKIVCPSTGNSIFGDGQTESLLSRAMQQIQRRRWRHILDSAVERVDSREKGMHYISPIAAPLIFPSEYFVSPLKRRERCRSRCRSICYCPSASADSGSSTCICPVLRGEQFASLFIQNKRTNADPCIFFPLLTRYYGEGRA